MTDPVSIDSCVAKIVETDIHIHALINNAGVSLVPKYTETKTGIEMNCQTNYMGVVQLTEKLLPVLEYVLFLLLFLFVLFLLLLLCMIIHSSSISLIHYPYMCVCDYFFVDEKQLRVVCLSPPSPTPRIHPRKSITTIFSSTKKNTNASLPISARSTSSHPLPCVLPVYIQL